MIRLYIQIICVFITFPFSQGRFQAETIYDLDACEKYATNKGIGGFLLANFSSFQNILKDWNNGAELASEFVSDINQMGTEEEGTYRTAFFNASMNFTVWPIKFSNLIAGLRPLCAPELPFMVGSNQVTITFLVANVTISGNYTLHGKIFDKHVFQASGNFDTLLSFRCSYRIYFFEGEGNCLKLGEESGAFCTEVGGNMKSKLTGNVKMISEGGKNYRNRNFLRAMVTRRFQNKLGQTASYSYSKIVEPAFRKYVEDVFASTPFLEIFDYGYDWEL